MAWPESNACSEKRCPSLPMSTAVLDSGKWLDFPLTEPCVQCPTCTAVHGGSVWNATVISSGWLFSLGTLFSQFQA